MKTLNLIDIVEDTTSNTEGFKLFQLLKQYVEEGNIVILKVENNHILSSSFLNSSIGEFLENYGTEKFKSTVKVKGNRTQFKRIAKYLKLYESTHLA